MFNKVILIGNLTRDVELKHTPQGTAVAQFGLAVNTKYGEKDEVYYGDIQVWGKQAENAEKYLYKGAKCLVEGRLKTETWEAKDGDKKSRTRIVADTIRYLSSPKERGGDNVPEEYTEQEPF